MMTVAKVGAIGAVVLYFLGKRKKEKGVGKVERIKRRIYKEVSLAQDAGVDFSKKYNDLNSAEIEALRHIGQDVIGWKQSKRAIESGKPYTESYYGSLRRAWNAVSGISGIGATTYDVRDAQGNVVLSWTDVTEHIEQEPDAHVLLALPPHVEEKPKTKHAKVSEEEYAEREEFAREFLEGYIERHPREGAFLQKPLLKQHYNGKWDIDDVPNNSYEGLIKTFAKKQLKTSNNNLWFIGVKTTTYGDVTGAARDAADALLDAWNNRYIEQGFEREDLDDIRRALLDKAKLMQVVINPYKEYEDKTHSVRYYNPYYDREVQKLVHDYGDVVSGDDRYNHLDKINYIVWTSSREFGHGGMTYYPIRSYPDYEGAEIFVLNRYKSGAKILPIWDVPIEKITGLF